MRRTLRSLAVLVAVTATFAAAACSSGDAKPATASNGAKADKVTYMTAFGAVGRDAFIWVAKEKGYFKDAGIDIDIKLGAASDTNLKALSAGKADIVAADFAGALVSEGNGKYGNVRAFAALQQRNLSSIVTLEGSSVATVKDLPGKKLGAANGSVVKMLFPAYAKLVGIDPNSVQWVQVAPTQLAPLMANNTVDALATFLISTPAIEKAAGKKTVVFPFSQYLTDLYGNGLFTTEETAKAKPDMIKRFRDAALKGLEYAITHPEEAGQTLNRNNPTANALSATGEIKLMTPYVSSAASGVLVGALDQQRVARNIATLQGAGLFGSGLTPDKVVDFDLTIGSA